MSILVGRGKKYPCWLVKYTSLAHYALRYVDMTEEGRRVDGDSEDVWQDY